MYFREIQGLRVIAALMVAVYHIWFHRVSGGVDAFFVIAGFFLFNSFLNRALPGTADVTRYYQRTFARIAPVASLVILATIVIFIGFGSPMFWQDRIRHALASVLFVENWYLASMRVDYLSLDDTPAPFQQFWALSVQMQMYLVLPLIALAVTRLSRRFRSPRRAAGLILGVLFLLALGYAMQMTRADQTKAYFNTAARLWEFLAGGLVAVLLPRLHLKPGPARLLGYSGLAVLVAHAGLLPPDWIRLGLRAPSLAAMIPVLATVAIIAAAANRADMRVLNNRPMQWLGDLSFTFYLWHWPLYILAWEYAGTPDVGLGTGLLILAGALGLSVLTLLLVERPFRRARIVTGRTALACIVCLLAMLPAAAGIGFWTAYDADFRESAQADLDASRRGEPIPRLIPAPIVAKLDSPVSYEQGCVQHAPEDARLIECSYGNPDGGTVIVLLGGSHALQWLDALQRIARDVPDLRIVTLSKSGCPLATSMEDIHLMVTPSVCEAWNRAAIDRTRALAPAGVVVVATRVKDGKETIPAAYGEVWNILGDLPILAIRDNPWAPFNIPSCVALHGPDSPQCQQRRDDVLRRAPFTAADVPPNVHLVDFSDRFCGEESCPATRDGMLIYRDSNHLSATFVTSLAPDLHRELQRMGLLSAPAQIAADRTRVSQ